MKSRNNFCLAALMILMLLIPKGFSQTSGFTVPATHPRLWWNPARLVQAKTWFATHPFSPNNSDPFGNALRYVLTGDTLNAKNAINWLVSYKLPAGQVLPTAIGCDNCRWDGENAILVFDWCFDKMTIAQRQSVIAQWNTDLANVNKQAWGGVGMEGNNYYWGNVRNSLEWGVASFTENPQAQSFLDNALTTRWHNSFLPYAAMGSAKGGALGEGPGYGSTMLGYPIIPFVSLELMGRGILHESPFYQEALMTLIYSTTPMAVIEGSNRFYDFFSYNEFETTDIIHSRTYFGDFMMTLANHWEPVNLGQYARHWIAKCNPSVSNFVQAVNAPGREKSFTSLPLDYYASGLGYLYARTSWDSTATAIQIQMKNAEGVGHDHRDWGSFQMFRQGRWLTRESRGYSQNILGVNGGNVDVGEPDAHNSIFVGVQDSMHSLIGFWQAAPATVKRLASSTNYAYAAVDLSSGYQSTEKPELGNPHVARIVREYLFVRPLETLVVFDRILTKDGGQTMAANATKMALIHFEATPVLQDANQALATLGNQAVRLTTLLPTTPTYKVVNEGPVGQNRLQISTSGAAQSYFLNVLQGRDAAGTDLTSQLTETSTSFSVILSHPTLGTATFTFLKGDTSSGGSFGYTATGTATTSTPLPSRVQAVTVNGNGPAWEGTSSIFNSFSKQSLQEVQLQVPNPYRPGAAILFNVPNSGLAVQNNRSMHGSVNLSIFTASGALVEEVCNEYLPPGMHRVFWAASRQKSGLYYVKLKTGSTVIMRKLILIK